MGKRKTTEQFIEESRKIHGDKYDYSKTNYIGALKNVTITCPIHGDFLQIPSNHLSGSGCKKCFHDSLKKKTEDFIKESKKVHGNKYDYSKTDLNKKDEKGRVCIICPIHGEFWQNPNDHSLYKHGCYLCANENNGNVRNLGTEKFIRKAKKIHGNRYDYSKTEYKSFKKDVCIICPKHGEFWQKPKVHLRGGGCNKCKLSHIEEEIIILLEKNKIKYTFRERSLSWLNGLELDFYLPYCKLAIECQGIQHFIGSHFFEPIEVVKERDERKRKLCEENGIKLLYYSNLGIEYPYEVFEDKEKLLEEIKKYGNS